MGFLQQPFTKTYKRIVSIVPSQTELLFSLGLDTEVIGITKFCVHPDSWYRNKKRVGGTKQLHLDEIIALEPDLIIANKEENIREEVSRLAEICDVYLSDIQNLADALKMIEDIGALTDRKEKASSIITSIQDGFKNLVPYQSDATVAYLIWKEPMMAVGSGTFIHSMMVACGFTNYFSFSSRYPETNIEELSECKWIFLSSEPYPFKEKDIDELQLKLPASRLILVDGEYFSWYGSRLLMAPNYFQELISEMKEL